MPQKISAKEVAIRDVFSNQFHFVIPGFQRPYCWGIDETDQLVDDLLAWTREQATKPAEQRDQYFLGSVVLVKADDEPTSTVIDGQQRLTTLSLLLSVCAHLQAEARETIMPMLREHGSRYIRGSADRLRIVPRDADFYADHIVPDEGFAGGLDPRRLSEGQRRLFCNASRIAERLGELPDTEVADLIVAVLNHTYIVVVTTADLSAAFRSFSVLNSRGMDLGPQDLIKARLLDAVAPGNRDAHTNTWQAVEELLGREGLDELFAHVRMIFMKTKLQNLLGEITADVLPRFRPMERFVGECLVPAADALRTLRHGVYEASSGADAANRSIRQLRRIDNSDWLPPAIAFIMRHGNEGPAVAAFLRDLERLAASLMLRRTNVNVRLERYGRVLRAIEADNNLASPRSPLQLAADECRATVRAIDADLYAQTRVRLPVLLRLDELMADSGASYDTTVSIEHVMPQQCTGSWLEVFPDGRVRDGWSGRLANLVLLSRRKNAQAGNLPFARKKKEYFGRGGIAPFALTTSVIETETWDVEVLELRQQQLVGLLAAEWRLA